MKLAGDITDQDKDDFLELVYDGHNRKTAAEQLGFTGSMFRKLSNPVSEHYDPVFAQHYDRAIESEQHAKGELEMIRDFQWTQMQKGDSQMIQKMSLVKDPVWAPLRHQNLNLNVNMLARLVPELPTEQIEQARDALMEKKGLKPPAQLEAVK